MSVERIKSVIKQLGITGYEVEKKTDLTQVGVDKILNGSTTKPRKTTVDILVNFLCDHHQVSRQWLETGEGEMLLIDESAQKIYLEKQGVRFELVELVDHFVQHKEAYLKQSEYLRLFVNDLIEKALKERLKELGIVVKGIPKKE